MTQAGKDAAHPDSQRQKAKRVKRGECPECGATLFKTATGMLGRIKKPIPINDAGKSLNGRCLACFPLDKSEEEEAAKKTPVPRTILTYQTNCLNGTGGLMNEDGSINENTDAGANLFGLDFDDDVSAITLDRRIRTNVEEIDNEKLPTEDIQRSHDIYRKVLPSSEKSEKSLRGRMEEYLKDEDGQVRGPMMISLRNEDRNEGNDDEFILEAKWVAPPEQAPPRRVKKAPTPEENTISSEIEIHGPDSANGGRWTRPPLASKSLTPSEQVTKPRPKTDVPVSRRNSDSGSSAARKAFLPSGMFIPSSNDETENCVVYEGPTKGNAKAAAAIVRSDMAIERPQSGKPSAEIFFDFASVPVIEKAPVKLGESDPIPVCAGEVSCFSGDSLMGFVTENSSSHNYDADEYSAFSSKLLIMLDQADGKMERISASKRSKESLLSAGRPDSAEEGHSNNDGKESARKSQPSIEVKVSAIAHSKIVGDETSSHGEVIPGPRRQPLLSPKRGERECRGAQMSPKKKPPPEPKKKIAPKSPERLSATLKKPPPPPLSELKVESILDVKKPSKDIPLLLRHLQNSSTQDHETALLRLTECIWDQGPPAKHQFIANNGIKLLAVTMWADMMIPSAERSAAELFLALVSTSSHIGSDTPSTIAPSVTFLGNEDTEDLIDALLITMQTLIVDEELQQVGCRILCCLASVVNDNGNDGTRSGACLAVLNAMDVHRSSDSVQEWGMRALYNQCVLSKHSDANKATFLTSKLDTSGVMGADILERLLVSGVHHLRNGGVLEWVCRLSWCLTASTTWMSKVFDVRMDALRELLHILEQCRSLDDASPQLQEAVLGTIANLAKVAHYKSFLGTSDVVLLILDTMHGNKEFVEVQIEASNVIANISCLLSPLEKEEIVDAGAVRTIVGAMFAFPRDKHALQEPALRALVGLAVDSEIAKEEICEYETLSVLMNLCRHDETSIVLQQELLCTLLASLYSSERLSSKALQCDSLGALTSAAAAYRNSEKIQGMACLAYRNVSRNVENLDSLIRCNAIGFAVSAMLIYGLAKPIVGNACSILWNIGAGTEYGHQEIAQTKAINCIVNAIQTHMEAPEVIEVACGALWVLIHRSRILREQFVDSECGVESVTCTLVMHPRAPVLLEMACGVLALSSANSRGTAAAVVSDGVGNVLDTMRINPKSTNILQHGAHFLRNTINSHHTFISDAAGVLSVLIDALKAFPREETFLSEACHFLWTIAELSFDAKSKIVALDGIPVLLSIMDPDDCNPIVRDAAFGAFKELTHESATRG